jgi:uncharacterized protein (TIGR02996 family)
MVEVVMTMSDHTHFLLALSPNPRDDVHRLIYADWLEEQGHPLSELLRLQYDIASRTEGNPAIADLHQRELTILADHGVRFQELVSTLIVNLEVEAAFKLAKDVLELSRRDPIHSACPDCGARCAEQPSTNDAGLLHWRLNPALAVNELLFGQRVLIPAVLLVCPTCRHPWSRSPVRCSACRRVHPGTTWEDGAFGQWTGFTCPDCQASIPMARNMLAGAVASLGSLAVRAVAAMIRSRSRS